MTVPLLNADRGWECPNCDHTRVVNARYGSVIHTCVGLADLVAPMVPVGTRAKIVAVEREDYVGTEQPQTDGVGRPIMAIVTVRDDGQDCRILAPTAVVTGGTRDGMVNV